jgi:hypothetical protein
LAALSLYYQQALLGKVTLAKEGRREKGEGRREKGLEGKGEVFNYSRITK